MADIFLYAGHGRLRYITNFSIVSDIDFEDANGFGFWTLDSKGYAWMQHKKKQVTYLHHFIAQRMGLEWNPLTHEIDHKNRVKLDNCRDNLRIATRSENKTNHIYKPGKSGYRGVHEIRRTGRWQTQIRAEGKIVHVGCYDTAEEAAFAYNVAAIHYFGEFAVLNVVK